MATKSPKFNSNTPNKPNETSNEVPSTFVDTHGVIISTMNDLPGYRIVKVLGTIYGITVRARNWGADLGAFLKSAVGGEIRFFTTLMYSSRNSAVERLVGECLQKGGNAIIAMRFDQGEVNTYAQVCAYGTAVVVEKIEDGHGAGIVTSQGSQA